MTTSMSWSLSGSASTAATSSGGRAVSRTPRSSVAARRSAPSPVAAPTLEAAARSRATGDLEVAHGCRDETGFRDPHEGLLHEQRDRCDLPEPLLLESTIGRCLVGSHGREDAVIRMAGAVGRCLPADDPEPEVDQGPEIGLRPPEQSKVVGLVLVGHTGLDEAIEVRTIGAVLDEAIQVGE